jgi:nucleoside-diphosphate-sugar epimerase
MRVFVTGASGAVGSRLLLLLLTAGHTVAGLTRTLANADAIRLLLRVPGEGGCNPIGLHRPFATNYAIPAQAGTHSAAGVELSDGTRSQK